MRASSSSLPGNSYVYTPRRARLRLDPSRQADLRVLAVRIPGEDNTCPRAFGKFAQDELAAVPLLLRSVEELGRIALARNPASRSVAHVATVCTQINRQHKALEHFFREASRAGTDSELRRAMDSIDRLLHDILSRLVKGQLRWEAVHLQHVSMACIACGLKALATTGIMGPAGEVPLKNAFAQLTVLIQHPDYLRRCTAFSLANLLNGLKAAVEKELIAPTDPGLKAAFLKLIGMVNDGKLDGGKPQEIANGFNGLKAALERGVIARNDADRKAALALQSAFRQLIALVTRGRLDAGKPQEIANAFNGLKAALEKGLIAPTDPHLRAAFHKLIGMVNDGKLDGGEPQHVVNSLNGLKAAFDKGVVTLNDRDPRAASGLDNAIVKLIEMASPAARPGPPPWRGWPEKAQSGAGVLGL